MVEKRTVDGLAGWLVNRPRKIDTAYLGANDLGKRYDCDGHLLTPGEEEEL